MLLDTKNGTSREVPLSAKAAEAMREPVTLAAGSISTLFAQACKAAGVEGLTFHDARHLACTRLAQKLTLLELCRMMGWRDPRHALRYYNEGADKIAAKL